MSKRRAHRRSERFDLQKRGVRIVLGSLAFTIMAGSLLGARLGLSTQVLAMAQEFLTFYAGVFSLVALTTTVGLGLLTSERMILPIKWRVRAQLVHRGAALIGVGFLVVHIGMKIAAGLVPSYGSVIPTTSLAVGAGAVASDLFIVIIATGVMRGRFALAVHPGSGAACTTSPTWPGPYRSCTAWRPVVLRPPGSRGATSSASSPSAPPS